MKRTAIKRNVNEHMLKVVERYIASGGAVPINPRDVARWAINNNEWDRHKFTAVTMCAKDIARALREDYYVDAHGREVRARHSIRIVKECADGTREQLTLWDDHRTMRREFAERSFQQRRQQIVGDCKQLKVDVDSYNDQHETAEKIQLILDFTWDIAEDDLGNAWKRAPKG